ncbi:MAG: hypothetical protein KGS44_16625 [Alphaproteobacteria bacterium]|nr:hypothetical protein [Alphaproteobacteria bacterium]
MAKTAATRAQPRMGGGGRRRTSVDSRQMELSFAPTSEPTASAFPPTVSVHARSYPRDLFEACSVDAGALQAPRKIEKLPQFAANDEISAETLALLDIVDFMIDLWRKESGEDIRPVIFPNR